MKLISTNLNGLQFWYREDDKFVGQRIALGKYEEYETMLIFGQAQDTAVAVDVGANIGYYTLLLAQKCKKVYAIEPDKDCFLILKKNVEENKLKNVVLINKAVGDKKEQRQLIKDKKNFGNNYIVEPTPNPSLKGGENSIMIKLDTLDELLKNEKKVDLIKIDVQGWESKVIAGAKKILKRDWPILFLEYNGEESLIKYLKNIYKNIWSIDYWYYIGRPGIWVDKKTGYTDLFIKNKFNLSDWWWMIKEIRIKKIMKRLLRRRTQDSSSQ